MNSKKSWSYNRPLCTPFLIKTWLLIEYFYLKILAKKSSSTCRRLPSKRKIRALCVPSSALRSVKPFQNFQPPAKTRYSFSAAFLYLNFRPIIHFEIWFISLCSYRILGVISNHLWIKALHAKIPKNICCIFFFTFEIFQV